METESLLSQLYTLFLRLQSEQQCADLFEDLFTKKELEQLARRVEAARLLQEGQTYAQVMEKTEISSATLSRISRCVQYGKGYKQFFPPQKKG